MKTVLIPALNAQTFEEIKQKIDLLKKEVDHFHLDVASKEFTGYETWQNVYDLERLDQTLFFDLHLMLSLKPQEIIKWSKKNIKRLILHLEASPYPEALIKMAKRTKKSLFIAWSPDVEFSFISKYLSLVEGILVLGVKPGKAGQKFLESTYERLSLVNDLRKKNYPKLKLMVDGGINENNLKEILKFNPEIVVMASAIYNSPNPLEKYMSIKKMIEETRS